MKKITVIFGIILLLLGGCLWSCQSPAFQSDNTNEENRVKEDFTDTNDERENVSNTYTSMDDFLETLQHLNGDQNPNVPNSNKPAASSNPLSGINDFIVPVLRIVEFEFMYLEINEYSFFYYYMPRETDNPLVFDYDKGIVVTISREENSFETVISQLGLLSQDGFALDSHRNTWHINNAGKNICIAFPCNVLIKDKDKLNDYFIFDRYVVGSDGINKIEPDSDQIK